MKQLLQNLLKLLTRAILRRARPAIVGVTGSIGKSSSKEAIALVLARGMSVRASTGNLNNEFGVPLSVIGVESPGRSLPGWLAVIGRGVWLALFPAAYPRVLVLEMGIDRPGDMDYLLAMTGTPAVSVLTHVSGSHLEFFGSVAAIGKEKGKLLAALDETGTAVVNADNEAAMKEASRTKGKLITYGFAKDATVRAEHLRIIQENGRIEGVSFKLAYAGKSVPVRLPGLLGQHQVSSILSAVAVGIAMKMNLVDIASALLEWQPLAGRLQVLPGRHGLTLLEDSYNASPASIHAALATMREIIAPRKVIILGDVLELGPAKLDEHRKLAHDILMSGATVFIGVGRYMEHLATALHGTTFPQAHIHHFADIEVALRTVPALLRSGDLVLIKGSQGLRMEKLSEALLDESVDPARVLPRQSASWRAKPFTPPTEWEVV